MKPTNATGPPNPTVPNFRKYAVSGQRRTLVSGELLAVSRSLRSDSASAFENAIDSTSPIICAETQARVSRTVFMTIEATIIDGASFGSNARYSKNDPAHNNKLAFRQ